MKKALVLLLTVVLSVFAPFFGGLAEEQEPDLLIHNMSEASDMELEKARQMILSEQLARIKPYVTLDQSEVRVAKGKNMQLKAEVKDLVNNLQAGSFEWRSSDESVVTVTKNGMIKAVSAGTAEVKCLCEVSDGTEIAATCTVTVYVPVQSIKVDSQSLRIIRGRKVTVVPTIVPEDATDKRVSYSVTDEHIAKVSDTGDITALEAGSFTLTLTALDGSGKSTMVKGIVLQDVQGIVFESEKVSIPAGKKVLLKPSLFPENSADKTLIWSCADENIATVNEKGQVTAVSLGTTTVTVQAAGGNGITASCQVTVVEPVQSVVLSDSSLEAVVTMSYQVTAKVLPETATNRDLVWSSSNEAVAIVDQSGNVTPVAKGNCVIKAEAVDGSGISAQIKVKVLQYDIVMTEFKKPITVTYDRLDLNSGMFLTDWDSKNGRVDISGGDGELVLTPVKSGPDRVTVKEREYFTKKNVSSSWTVYVAPSAVEEW